MADEFDDDDELGEGDGSGSGGGLKKMLLFVGAPVLLLIIGGAVAYFLGALDSFFGPSPEELEAEQQRTDSLGYFLELEEMLVNVADAYDTAVENRVEVLTRLLEPIIILVMGGAVAFIAFAVLMPMLELRSV